MPTILTISAILDAADHLSPAAHLIRTGGIRTGPALPRPIRIRKAESLGQGLWLGLPNKCPTYFSSFG